MFNQIYVYTMEGVELYLGAWLKLAVTALSSFEGIEQPKFTARIEHAAMTTPAAMMP